MLSASATGWLQITAAGDLINRIDWRLVEECPPVPSDLKWLQGALIPLPKWDLVIPDCQNRTLVDGEKHLFCWTGDLFFYRHPWKRGQLCDLRHNHRGHDLRILDDHHHRRQTALFGFPALGVIGYLFSGLMGIWLLINIIRKRKYWCAMWLKLLFNSEARLWKSSTDILIPFLLFWIIKIIILFGELRSDFPKQLS